MYLQPKITMNHMVMEVNLSTLITVYPEYYVEINWQLGFQNMLLEIYPKVQVE